MTWTLHAPDLVFNGPNRTLIWPWQCCGLRQKSGSFKKFEDLREVESEKVAPYSARNVIAGSTWAARHAGSQQAMMEMPTSSADVSR